MKIIPIDTLYCMDVTFTDVIPTIRYHKENAKYSLMSPTKPFNTLIYFNTCSGTYTSPGISPITAIPGNIIYIPTNTPYEVSFFDTKTGAPNCIRIEFNIYDRHGEEVVLSNTITNLEFNHTTYVYEKFLKMATLHNAPFIPLMNIKSIFYDILYNISITAHMHNLSQNEFSTIHEGIKYIETDTEQSKSIAEIAKMCHVSESYFRTLFKKYSGLSPTDYRISKKIERAKELIANSTMTITEVAYELNFKNVHYFSRLFKTKVGTTPNEYQKKYGK